MVATTPLLPFPDIQLDTITLTPARITVRLTATAPRAACPACQQISARLHSRYSRTLADLPWATCPVQFHITVRRFFCDNPTCPRRIFGESLAALTARYARRTQRLTTHLRRLVLLTGGQTAARLAQTGAISVSPRTLLRVAHAPAPAERGKSRRIGVDDWAWSKGVEYGTLIVDLDRHQPVALLADRTVESFAAWLQEHPEVEIISRDRSAIYAQAATQGAPQAVQVADRFHLVKNLVEALEKLFMRKSALLTTAARPPAPQPAQVPPIEDTVEDTVAPLQDDMDGTGAAPRPVPAATPTPSGPAAMAQTARHQRMVAYYTRIHELRAKHLMISDIAQQVGLSGRRVRQYLAMAEPPAPRQRPEPRWRNLDAYQSYLVRRWNEGCRNARQLWREIAGQGYMGSVRTVTLFIARLRRDSGQSRRFKAVGAQLIYAPNAKPLGRPWTPRQAARIGVVREARRRPEHTAYWERLRAADEEVQEASDLAGSFLAMARERTGSQLAKWLEQAEASKVPEMRAFARSLRSDEAAVAAGLTLEWSNGQTEAQVGRLKTLKRTMNGRVDLPLLRARVLYRPPALQLLRPRQRPTVAQAA